MSYPENDQTRIMQITRMDESIKTVTCVRAAEWQKQRLVLVYQLGESRGRLTQMKQAVCSVIIP